ncbi:hypothetical protein FVEN_g8124 [Fusarium venenatum]|uniref:Heterokaryon incompatibility domain-containing protein n=1 Tax=Fusarium venenatum TaxID=56646 RepID=A0A2L2TAY5_9HYPO|nr:uncharacterized protein FVRRES_04522 [Fusarium venenatum]KAG8353862.1 hypothetical protein FVEN_g8124 [Fusarium venenatum]CEI60086.1 unnamed protein product [Fusarium venenatum]
MVHTLSTPRMPQTDTQSWETQDRTDAPLNTCIQQLQLAPDDMSHLLEFPQIDLHSHQIRILHILPGNRDDLLRCVLRTASLDDNHKYEALSYVWGDPLDHLSIEVNGSQKNVTVNLFNALRRLRYAQNERCLWVDALCIDQENDVEKSHQVQLMSKIYSRTTTAILWLGDFSDGLNDKPNYISYKAVRSAFNLIKLLANSSDVCINHGENEDLINDGWAGLSCLLQLPWWHRAWTVQETVLPADAIVVCGTSQLPFSWLKKAYNNSTNHYYRNCCGSLTVPETFWNQMHALIYVKGHIEENNGFLGYAFNLFRNRHASDPRDKLYAYLGLGSGISADYSLPYEQVFKLATRSLIEKHGTLMSLLRTAEEERSPTLPSWVPDWCAKIHNQDYNDELGWYCLYQHYNASGDRRPQISPSCSDNVLKMRGLILKRITKVGDIMDYGDTVRKMVIKWQGGPNDEYPQGETYLKAS